LCEMGDKENARGGLKSFLEALEGTPVPRRELVAAGHQMAQVLVAHGRPVILTGHGRWAGVWDLERLTDDEAVAWGIWMARRVRPSGRR
jgi:hypothetical protein